MQEKWQKLSEKQRRAWLIGGAVFWVLVVVAVTVISFNSPARRTYRADQTEQAAFNQQLYADPILPLLPHEELKWQLSPVLGESGLDYLQAEIFLDQSDYKGQSEAAAVASYQAEILAWLRAEGFAPEDYRIEWVW